MRRCHLVDAAAASPQVRSARLPMMPSSARTLIATGIPLFRQKGESGEQSAKAVLGGRDVGGCSADRRRRPVDLAGRERAGRGPGDDQPRADRRHARHEPGGRPAGRTGSRTLRPATWRTSRSRPATRRAASPSTCASTRSRAPAARRSPRWAASSTRRATRPPARRTAAKDPKTGAPVANPARETWVTQRALATGLELAFVGEQVSVFAIATGALFVVVGIGLLVMLLVGGVLGNPFERHAPG